MCLPITGYSTTVVKKPRVGEVVPSEVIGEIQFSVKGLLPQVKGEWDQLHEFDTVFLMAVHPPETNPVLQVDTLTVEDWPRVLGYVYSN